MALNKDNFCLITDHQFILNLFDSDELVVTSEDQVLDAVLAYIQPEEPRKDPLTKGQNEQAIAAVRLSLLSAEKLTKLCEVVDCLPWKFICLSFAIAQCKTLEDRESFLVARAADLKCLSIPGKRFYPRACQRETLQKEVKEQEPGGDPDPGASGGDRDREWIHMLHEVESELIGGEHVATILSWLPKLL